MRNQCLTLGIEELRCDSWFKNMLAAPALRQCELLCTVLYVLVCSSVAPPCEN